MSLITARKRSLRRLCLCYVMFLQVSVCPHQGGGACMVLLGGACVVLFGGVCMVLFGGMHGFIWVGHAWFYPGGTWFYSGGMCGFSGGGGMSGFFSFFGYN